jgi:hypothetical protein
MLGTGDGHDTHTYHTTHSSVHSIFGRQLTVQELSNIPGLAKLQHVTLLIDDLEWSWCVLPSLQELSLGLFCSMEDFEDRPVHRVSMYCKRVSFHMS